MKRILRPFTIFGLCLGLALAFSPLFMQLYAGFRQWQLQQEWEQADNSPASASQTSPQASEGDAAPADSKQSVPPGAAGRGSDPFAGSAFAEPRPDTRLSSAPTRLDSTTSNQPTGLESGSRFPTSTEAVPPIAEEVTFRPVEHHVDLPPVPVTEDTPGDPLIAASRVQAKSRHPVQAPPSSGSRSSVHGSSPVRAVATDSPTYDPGNLLRLQIPRLHLSAVVDSDVSNVELAEAPGHFPETAMPWEEGNCVIAAHRNIWGSWFAHLDRLKKGDPIILETPRWHFVYRVTGERLVSPRDTSILQDHPHKSEVTLVTCTYPAIHRIVVTGIWERTIHTTAR